jgi:hypothetical protein
MLPPVLGRSLLSGFRSLIERFNSLFGRLGIAFEFSFEVNRLRERVSLSNGA